MKKTNRSIFFLILLLLCTGLARADEPSYHWPLDARPALTSTFGEYRNGRFHAGIDLKTWGQEGFPVWAVDDGAITRVRTSPWDYGRVIYQKLRDGRTALYAHLSGFAPRLAARVEAEQDQKGTYSVDLALDPAQLPVKRGEVIGFSGSSGVGMPHLHFELRDEAMPINALEHGFKVADTIPPVIQALALTPLNAASCVAGGHDPYPFKVLWDPGRGRSLSPGRVTVHGQIGVAADVFDQADSSASTNRLAPYRLRLLADGVEVFQTTYSTFGYPDNHQVELDRSFALARRGAGRLHNLYRATGNRLPLYNGYQEGDGVLHAGVAPGERGLPLTQGLHLLRVVAEDFQGNRSEAEAEVLADAVPEVRDFQAEMERNVLHLSAEVQDADGDSLMVTLERSGDGGQTWWGMAQWLNIPGTRVKFDARGQDATPGLLYRVRARDPYGLEAFGTCATPVSPPTPAADDAPLACLPDLYPDFALLRLTSDRVLNRAPQVTATWPGGAQKALPVRQSDLCAYEAVIPFGPEASGAVTVTVSGVSREGIAGSQTLTLTQQIITPDGGSVRSPDGMAEARFDAHRVYAPLFARAEVVQAEGKPGLPLVGAAYRFTPNDVPFDGTADLTLHYPPGFDRPGRLGLYRRSDDGAWRFLDNKVDTKAGTLSAGISTFSTYGLLLDEMPPVIADLKPASGAKVADRQPTLSALIRDAGAGIWREEDIIMTLDGNRLIAVYDPDKELVTARPKKPLKPGKHRLEVTVRDVCGNEARAVSAFGVR